MDNAKPTKLFGILSKTIRGVTPHTFGAIFDVDENGKVTGATPIDFNGQTVLDYRFNEQGRADPTGDCKIRVDKAVFFPISDASANAMLQILEYIKTPEGKLRFKPNNRDGRDPDFLQFVQPVSDGVVLDKRRITTNCRDFIAGALEVSGVPLSDIRDGEHVLPHDVSSKEIRHFIAKMTDTHDIPYGLERFGKMHDAADGRKFYAYSGPANIVDALNEMPKDTQGRSVAQQVLEDSAPFYDASRVQVPTHRVVGAQLVASRPVEMASTQTATR